MTERPILFSAPMVRAILDGRKTQTRRVLKPQPISQGLKSFGEAWCWKWPGNGFAGVTAQQISRFGVASGMSPYALGDRLWVRETWRPLPGYSNWDFRIHYGADGVEVHFEDGEVDVDDWLWPKAAAKGMVTPLHMPRWASRITLEVTDVRVQRLQEISEADAIAEGCRPCFNRSKSELVNGIEMSPLEGPLDMFSDLWRSLHGAGSWEANPWVVAVNFRRLEA